jgi:hypothetical protein
MRKMNKFALLIMISFTLIQSCAVKDKEEETQQLTKQITSPAAEKSEEPNLIAGADGNLYLSWVERQDENATLKFSKWVDSKWSSPETIAEGDDWFVNWADYPAMAVNKSGDKIAHYLQMSDTGSYTYDVKVVSKKSNDTKWSEPIKLHRDSVNAEHGFVSMLPMDDGNFFLTWLDGRNTMSADAGEHEGHGGGGAMTIRAATLSTNLDLSNEVELDGRVCDCCQTSATMTDKGPVVTYRDRSEDEIRDMSIVRLVNGSWTSPETINNDHWNIAGCPVNGPRIVARSNNVAVAWFTSPDGVAKVNLAFSNNSGATFAEPIQLDQGKAIGRVDIDMIDAETIFVSWMEGSDVVAAKVDNEGNILKRYQLTASSESRSSGFPQIALIGNEVMLAWTDSDVKKVKTAVLAL